MTTCFSKEVSNHFQTRMYFPKQLIMTVMKVSIPSMVSLNLPLSVLLFLF